MRTAWANAQLMTRRNVGARKAEQVRIFMPPVPGTDWNDVLLGKAPARVMEFR